jgi:hypothetical protein
MPETNIESSIKPLKDILFTNNLVIPDYQRPYKWQAKHVKQLLDDIYLHRDKSSYRIGTIIIHRDEKNNLNIVDGQQRLLTLTLILFALQRHEKPEIVKFLNKNISGDLALISTKFDNKISQKNLKYNYQEIQRILKSYTEEQVLFLLIKCEVVYFELEDISEAFQLFDAQNSRGKSLEPHDLLKAFHLREMVTLSEAEKLSCVRSWEAMPEKQLAKIFSNYLFRVRKWSKKESARYFTKNHINTFKGITLTAKVNYPYVNSFRINHFFTEQYNADYQRNIDLNPMQYPFQLDQTIINGKRFFEMIEYYNGLIKKLEATHNITKLDQRKEIEVLSLLASDETSQVFKIYKCLSEYDGRRRTGDEYVRILFDCTVLYYIDRFGQHDLDKVILICFIWSYQLRLKRHSVQLASMDNHGTGKDTVNLFKVIREATYPKDVYQVHLPQSVALKASKVDKIIMLFKENNYNVDKS